VGPDPALGLRRLADGARGPPTTIVYPASHSPREHDARGRAIRTSSTSARTGARSSDGPRIAWWSRLSDAARLRPAEHAPAWAFALVAPATFAVQELLELSLHTGTFGWRDPVMAPTFPPGPCCCEASVRRSRVRRRPPAALAQHAVSASRSRTPAPRSSRRRRKPSRGLARLRPAAQRPRRRPRAPPRFCRLNHLGETRRHKGEDNDSSDRARRGRRARSARRRGVGGGARPRQPARRALRRGPGVHARRSDGERRSDHDLGRADAAQRICDRLLLSHPGLESGRSNRRDRARTPRSRR
jgi:hypothetical protein